MRPAMRDLIARIPKRRGFRNKPHTEKPVTISAKKIVKFSGEITPELLRKEGLVSKRHRGIIKIIGVAEFKKPVTLKGVKASAALKTLIERAGGAVV